MYFVPLQVKGQISDMALCTIDEETKISILAKLFFTELARKGNALYNVMPDIISRYRFLITFYLSLFNFKLCEGVFDLDNPF
jgi:hypothetical protein